MPQKDIAITVVDTPSHFDRYDRQGHRLQHIAGQLARLVNEKDEHYGSSWQKRGGPGAFFVIARKWDRIEQACETADHQYDLFHLFATDTRQETILSDCIDLAGYLLVLMEHMVEIGNVRYIEELKLQFRDVGEKKKILKTPGPKLSGMEQPFGYDQDQDAIPADQGGDL